MFTARTNTSGIHSFSKSLETNLQQELDNITRKIQEDIKQAVPKDTGALSASISAITSKGNDMGRNITTVGGINSKAKIVLPSMSLGKYSNLVFSVVDYAVYNEYGGRGRGGLFSFSRVIAANRPIFMTNLQNAIRRSK